MDRLYFYIILLLTLFIGLRGSAQDITLSTQAEVDAFDQSITEITGYLHIQTAFSTTDPITNLNTLSNLTSVGGYLSIYVNDALLQIDGLSSVTIIGGYLIILNNELLTQINGLSNVITIGGYLQIQGNELLTQIDGLSNLTTIGGYLNVGNNELLTQIDGLSSVTTIGGNIEFQNNTSLTQLDGLNAVTSILGSLEIKSNASLIQIDGLSNVTSINGNLYIMSNVALTHIDGLSNVTRIDGFIVIDSNTALSQINGLSNLTSHERYLSISYNSTLTQLDGLSNLTSLGLSLTIIYNNALAHIDGLSNIATIGGFLNISNNSVLTDCCGIQDILIAPGAIDGVISIYDNPSECSSSGEIISACGLSMSTFLYPPCINIANGSIFLEIADFDTIPFSYTWTRMEDGSIGMGISQSEFFSIDNLPAGTYDIMVTTPGPDTVTQSGIVLSQLVGSIFEVIELTTTNSSNGFNNGAIQISIAGGTAPYTYTWSGPLTGSQSGINVSSFSIPNLAQGEYTVTVADDAGSQQMTRVSVLDETIPIFPCTEPLDIVILNDVSGSVDATEYRESQQFFIDFLSEANIGLDVDESRAGIIEWSDGSSQDIRIPMTGEINDFNRYIGLNRFFEGGTNPQAAMLFGENYLSMVARPDVARVIILSTDGSSGQISPSLVALADRLKAEGYHIMTIAFDDAFASNYTRDLLRQVASIDVLAPGAPAYSLLDQNLAEQIVNLYLCPIDPGSSATAYFNRDGAIDILSATPIGNCPFPDQVEITFTVEALRELSIPAGTPITFYNNNPELFGATPILTWIISCAIPVGTAETFTVTIPISGPSHIYAILNDDGSQAPPISLPITNIEEIAYSNNVDDALVCQNGSAILQAIKSTTTPRPICNSTVVYNIDVCNVSEIDAFDVVITDVPPADFVLVGTTININGCAIEDSGTFDITAGCCVSLTLTYDASGAANGYYNDQDVGLSGPSNQTYYDFDGAPTTREDVIIDGTIDCGSTTIDFTKSVNITETCDDSYVVYTFTIDNQLNIPLQGLMFMDVMPDPVIWAFEPYNLQGLSIGSREISGSMANFIIDEVEANTVASFSMDANLGDWDVWGDLMNTATLSFVPDLLNGGFRTLTSNSVTTEVTASPEAMLPDTIIVVSGDNLITLNAGIVGVDQIRWTTSGDGQFMDSLNTITDYVFGMQDYIDGEISLFFSIENDCGEYGHNVTVILEETPCMLQIDLLDIGICDDNDTNTDAADDTYEVTINTSTISPGSSNTYTINDGINNYGPFNYGVDQTIILPADGTVYNLEITDADDLNCLIQTQVNQNSCSTTCGIRIDNLVIGACDDNGTYTDTSDDIYEVLTNISTMNPGASSMFIINDGINSYGPFNYGIDEMITLPADGIVYNLTITDVGDVSCMIQTQVSQDPCQVESDYDLFIPNAFTPNGDGTNDFFRIYTGDGITEISSFKIFGRWGEMVFNVGPFSPNDNLNPEFTWDGLFKGERMDTGVFIYFIEYVLDSGRVEQSSGDVTLIR